MSNDTAASASAAPAPPEGLLSPEEAWATEIAAALRLILAAAADEPKEARERSMEELVREKLQPVPPAQRTLYLERLEERFPTGHFAPPAGAAASPDKGADSPEELARFVAGAWEKFSPEQREVFREELARSGIAADKQGGTGFDASEVRQRFGLAANESLAPQRLGRLSIQQMEFLSKLDQLAWNTWRTLAPRSSIKRDTALGDLRLQTRRYLKGESQPSDLQIAQQIERTRQLIAMLLGSISQISRGYAKRHQTRYSPEAIQDLVKMVGSGSWGFEGKCWRKYSELAGEINEATIQNEMQEVVVKYVEDLMRGTARSGA